MRVLGRSPRTSLAGLGPALALLVAWALERFFEVQVPDDVEQALVLVAVLGVAYFARDDVVTSEGTSTKERRG